MNSKLISIMLMVVFVGGAFAAIDVQTVVSLYNSNVDQVPDFVKGTLGDEKLHIYFTYSTGQLIEYAAITENGLITEADLWTDRNGNGNHDAWEGRNISPTMALHSGEDTFMGIADSADPMAAFEGAWGDTIRFEALNLGAGVKLFIVDVGMWLFGLF